MTIFGILEIIAAVLFLIIEIFILFFALVGFACIAHEVVKEWRDKRKEKKNGNKGCKSHRGNPCG